MQRIGEEKNVGWREDEAENDLIRILLRWEGGGSFGWSTRCDICFTVLLGVCC